MSIQNVWRFMVVDDDPINNIICSKYIRILFPDAMIETFTNPETGVEHLLANCNSDTVLFLDINMPLLTGWDVLEKIMDFPESIKKQLKIFILSSSVALEDKQLAEGNSLVSGYVEKPLNVGQLQKMLTGLS